MKVESTCWVPSPPAHPPLTPPSPFEGRLTISEVTGAQETAGVILNRLQWDSVRLKSLGLCHYSVLLATRGAGAEGAARWRADAASRLWGCGQSRVSSRSPPTHYSLDSDSHVWSSRNAAVTLKQPPLSYQPHVLSVHRVTPPPPKTCPPFPVRLPFPVCKNLWAQDLEGSPSAHIIMG